VTRINPQRRRLEEFNLEWDRERRGTAAVHAAGEVWRTLATTFLFAASEGRPSASTTSAGASGCRP
jgi:hypothetical protein